MAKNSYFYVLFCKDGSLYGGYTVDLKRRLKEHNEGIGAKYTRVKSRRPLKMVYAETYPSKSDALKAEAAFKKKTRLKKEQFLEKQGMVFPIGAGSLLLIKEDEPNVLTEEGIKHANSEKL